jgi:hypothetical protein
MELAGVLMPHKQRFWARQYMRIVVTALGITALLVAVFFSSKNRAVGSSSDGGSSSQERAAASALFGRFETVFYSKATLLSGSVSKQGAAAAGLPFTYLQGALNALGNNTSADIFASSEAVLVGARDFRPPSGLGSVRSQSCYVVVLRDRNTFDLRKYIHQSPTAVENGTTVWNWSAKLGEFGEGDPRPSSLYATQIKQDYVLVSNDLGELRKIADVLSLKEDDAKGLSSIRDWASISRHDVWGYRRYRQEGIVDRKAAGMTDVTPGAEALAFFFDSGDKSGVLQLFCSPADDSTASKMNEASGLPPFRQVRLGVWQSKISLVVDVTVSEQLFGTMGLFGFGVYL